jgi:hypothetical protein
MTKHTPGPWKIEPELRSDIVRIMPDNGIVQGSLVPVASRVSPENAALIAAAPDLLEALREVVNTFTPEAWPEPQRSMLMNARAAIAKATGGAA